MSCFPSVLKRFLLAIVSALVFAGLGFLVCTRSVYDQRLFALHHLELLLRSERLHTHPGPRCALGTAAVVNRSAGLDCVPVSPLGSVVMPGVCEF